VKATRSLVSGDIRVVQAADTLQFDRRRAAVERDERITAGTRHIVMLREVGEIMAFQVQMIVARDEVRDDLVPGGEHGEYLAGASRHVMAQTARRCIEAELEPALAVVAELAGVAASDQRRNAAHVAQVMAACHRDAQLSVDGSLTVLENRVVAGTEVYGVVTAKTRLGVLLMIVVVRMIVVVLVVITVLTALDRVVTVVIVVNFVIVAIVVATGNRTGGCHCYSPSNLELKRLSHDSAI